MLLKKYRLLYIWNKKYITLTTIIDFCKSIFKIYIFFIISVTHIAPCIIQGYCGNYTAAFIMHRYDDYVEGKKNLLDGYRERAIFSIRVHTRQRDIPRSYWPYQKREQISFLVFSCAEKMLLTLDKIRIAIKIYPDRFFASSSPWKYDASSSIKHTGTQHTRINAL